MNFTGKIKRIVTQGNNKFGFICSPDSNTHWQINRDIIFWESSVIGGLFSSLSEKDIVEFHTSRWTQQNGSVRIVARQIKSRISGVIKFIRVDNNDQSRFWGYIQPDNNNNNWLGYTSPVAFFSDSFQDNTLHNFIDSFSFNSNIINRLLNNIRVDFAIQDWQANNKDITKVARKIKFTDAQLKQTPFTVTTTKLLQDKIVDLLYSIETVSDPFEFEDLVFNLLRLIGINKIYQYDRNNAAGRADGVFISGNLAVIYDCKLNSQFRQNSQTQMLNYKNQLKQASSITIDEKRENGKVITRTLSIPKNREVWFITRGNTSIIQNTDNICVREVSVKFLIDVFNQKLDSRIFGQLN